MGLQEILQTHRNYIFSQISDNLMMTRNNEKQF